MIQRAAFRTLQTQDPQVVKKYMEVLTFQINYHKLETKKRALHDAASGGQFSDRQRDDYERTDRLLTECMLYAESQSGRLYSKQYQWSPGCSSPPILANVFEEAKRHKDKRDKTCNPCQGHQDNL